MKNSKLVRYSFGIGLGLLIGLLGGIIFDSISLGIAVGPVLGIGQGFLFSSVSGAETSP